MAEADREVQADEIVHHGSARKDRAKKARKKQANMQPPLTPMIDVTFQLLLFFLLTCEFRESEGLIPASLPAKGTMAQQVDDKPPPDPIRIRIRPGQTAEQANYEITGVDFVIATPEELYQFLDQRAEKVGSREVPIVILPTGDVPWTFVVQAFNQAVRAKYEKIGFAQEVIGSAVEIRRWEGGPKHDFSEGWKPPDVQAA